MAISTTKRDSPDATSSAYDVQAPFWSMVDTILAGTNAIRAAGPLYLPKYQSEILRNDTRYEQRLANAKFTNIYADIVENLAAKPMAKEVTLVEGSSSERIDELCEDIDGAGNNLHVFSHRVLFNGINRGIDWVYVDYPKSRPGLTIAQERAANLRPYAVHIPATDMLAVYSTRIGGEEQFVHARWREVTVRQSGFLETVTERIRVIERESTVTLDDVGNEVVSWGPPVYRVWERVAKGTGRVAKSSWEIVDQGPIPLDIIPLVPVLAGRRIDTSWVVRPPLADCAYLQIQHYQQESSLKNIQELAAYPMLVGSGVTPQTETVEIGGKTITRPIPAPTGPGAVLYAPRARMARQQARGSSSSRQPTPCGSLPSRSRSPSSRCVSSDGSR